MTRRFVIDLISLIQDGSASFFYLAAVGLLLGALHGLEPGHSKTMMAAFIVAVRGTPFQAFLLGVSAAISHSIIVWVLAVLALTYGDKMIGEKLEPYFVMASGAIIIGVGALMLSRATGLHRPSAITTGRSHRRHAHDHGHGHAHSHDHPHTDDQRHRAHEHHTPEHHTPEHHTHERHDHGRHTHVGQVDAHALAHARDIETRFADGKATNWQTIGFGLVGGLIPCPAAITVLLLCLGIGQFWLGMGMVSAFSAGLALTLVGVGLVAALGIRYATTHYASVDHLLRAAPALSAGLILVVGCYMAYSGYLHLGH